jgi:hypothetical protein
MRQARASAEGTPGGCAVAAARISTPSEARAAAASLRTAATASAKFTTTPSRTASQDAPSQ